MKSICKICSGIEAAIDDTGALWDQRRGYSCEEVEPVRKLTIKCSAAVRIALVSQCVGAGGWRAWVGDQHAWVGAGVCG